LCPGGSFLLPRKFLDKDWEEPHRQTGKPELDHLAKVIQEDLTRQVMRIALRCLTVKLASTKYLEANG
jgi:hypothetical protein